jgi:hypothetical protein
MNSIIPFDTISIKTEQLTKSCVVEDFFIDDISFYHSHCIEILRNICKEGSSAKFRVWIDGVESRDYRQKVTDNPPDFNETFSAWANRVFNSLKFGIIINNVEKYDSDLNTKVLETLRTMGNNQIPPGGFDMAFFIGNYDRTPLGIHKDLQGGKTIHFHLGPGEKTIYQWDDPIIEHYSHNLPNDVDFDLLLPHAKKFSFKEGDIFFMPENIWHVGRSNGLSMALSCWFNFFSRYQLLDDLIKYTRERLLIKNENPVPSFTNEEDIYSLEKPIFQFNLLPERRKIIEDFFSDLYDSYRLELLSNGGFVSPPYELYAVTGINLESKIKLCQPYLIFHKELNDSKTSLFVRGRQVIIPNHIELHKFISNINSGQIFQVKDLIHPLLDEWSEELALYVISQLISHHGVIVVLT